VEVRKAGLDCGDDGRNGGGTCDATASGAGLDGERGGVDGDWCNKATRYATREREVLSLARRRFLGGELS
jgi:hypothetical protein